jgi:RNA polymerase sigma-70 factor, ECF subfamily
VKASTRCFDAAGTLILRGARPPQPAANDMRQPEEGQAAAAAFWECLEPVKGKVYNYVLKSVNFSQDADDVYQESVLQALRYFQTFRKEASFEAWLFSIAHNEIKKHFKKIAKLPAPLDIDRADPAAAGPARELVKEVYRYAEKLAPRQREVFFLFYDSGFSIAEISGITGCRAGNIKFILNRARTNLKTIMGEKDERR